MPQTKVNDARYPWAEEIAAGRVVKRVGGEEAFQKLTEDMAQAVNRFVMEAIQLAVDERRPLRPAAAPGQDIRASVGSPLG
jgi:hypothetical protein